MSTQGVYVVRGPDDIEVLLGIFPSKELALHYFNANEAKSRCGGKQFAFADAENIGDWFLIEDGAMLPLQYQRKV